MTSSCNVVREERGGSVKYRLSMILNGFSTAILVLSKAAKPRLSRKPFQ